MEDKKLEGLTINSDVSVKQRKDPYFSYKLTKQIIVVIVFVCMGMSAEMIGPTLPDLKDKIGVDYEEISRALVGKDIGSFIGAVAGGFLHEALCGHTDLIISVSMLLLATATALTPWSTTVPMAGTCFAFIGMGISLIDTGAHALVMHLWQEKATSPVHAMHFGYGLGAFLAPQIARPFLSKEQDNITQATTVMFEDDDDTSWIEIPYCTVAVIVAIIGVVMLGFYIKGPPKGFALRKPSTSKLSDMISPGSCSDGYVLYGFAMILCLALYFLQAIGGESAYGKFIFSYAYETELLDKDQASVLTSVFWLSYTLSRLAAIPLTSFVQLRWIMIWDFCLTIFCSCILALFAIDNVNILWVFTAVMGLCVSVVYPNGMSWANLHLNVNSVALMVLVIGGSIGGIIYNYLTGYLFENNGPETLMYVMVLYSIGITIVFIAMLLVSKFLHPDKSSYPVSMDSELQIYKHEGVWNSTYIHEDKNESL